MTRAQWFDHLLNGTGPLDPDNVDSLTAAPALLKLLRESIVLPWPEHEEPEREEENDVPFYAMLLLGLLRDEKSIAPLIEVVTHGVEDDWDAVSEIGPPTIGAIGPKALPLVFAELERIERDEMIDSVKIESEDLDATRVYRYWELVIVVEQIALNHPEVRADVVRFAESRLRSTRYDRPVAPAPSDDDELDIELLTITEMWVDRQLSLRYDELDDAIDDFFERHGEHYRSSVFGTRADFDDLMATEPPTGNARERLLKYYRDLRAGGLEEDDELDLEGLIDDEDEEDDDDDEDDEEDEWQEPYVRPEPKIGRNDPCPCGSGKKYKKCHGA